MGRHKEWRLVAKKMRRKRIRQMKAKERDSKAAAEQEFLERSPRYQLIIAEQHALEVFQEEEEARQEILRHQQWLKNEEIAKQQFVARLERQAVARQEKINQDKLIREEWEAEQSKLKLIEDEKRKVQEEKKRKQDELMQQIDDFIKKGGELPASVTISNQTNPDKPPCPFFSKTGACRFGDRCSRNHVRPGVSKVLLIPSFYSHFGMNQSVDSEYDTDLMLEYEDSETYQDFKDFYEDVLPEFELHGDVVQFKVCCNAEPHLRGNVYVEFSSERQAVQAYQKFHGRFYGGRQITVEFTCVFSWKAALCGMFFKKRCPKGRNCNFLHVFRNPSGRFNHADRDIAPRRQRSPSTVSFNSPPRSRSRSHRGHWRWSESPPPGVKTNGSRDRHTPRQARERRDGSESPRRGYDSKERHLPSRERERRDRSESNRSKRRSSERSSQRNSSRRKEKKRKSRSKS